MSYPTLNYPTIYTSPNDKHAVYHDASDPDAEIAVEDISTGEIIWLDHDEAIGAAQAILTALDEAPRVVLASNVSLNEGVIRLAGAHGREVSFNYAKGDGTVIEPRRFVPVEVKEVKDKETTVTLVIGRDPDRDGEFRSYRVDRIKGDVGLS